MVTPFSPGSGSGVGGSGNPGAPQNPTQYDVDLSPMVRVQKDRLAIGPDSVDFSFTQVTQRYSDSYLGTNTGYQATRNQPFLDHPIDSQRLASLTPLLADDPLIAQNYDDLVNLLSPEVKARFLYEAQKPLEERDPSFVAMDNLLQEAATLLTHTSRLSQTPAPDSLEAARTQFNLMLPLIALRNVGSEGTQIMGHVDDLRNKLGANYRYADDLTNASIQLNDTLSGLQSVDLHSLLPNQEEPTHE